jgi:uncharacterized protein
MAIEVVFGEDPGWVLRKAGAFLASDPVRHNLILTLLHARVAYPEPGRYWVARDGDTVVGVVFQSPLHFFRQPHPDEPRGGCSIGGRFRRNRRHLTWRERRGSHGGALRRAVDGARGFSSVSRRRPTHIYELTRTPRATAADGRMRRATLDDRGLVLAWTRSFFTDVGEEARGLESMVGRRLEAGHFWLWEDGGPVSMAANPEPVEGVVRVQGVYTPPERRNRGYAGARVASLSRRMEEAGHRCILYTALGNPTSNSVYRRIGYRAVAEGLRYRFT